MIKIIIKIVIFINHAINSIIINQIKLIFNSFDKLNFRLMKIFIYLFQFQLNIKYRLDKQHVIFNVFFRLFAAENFGNSKLNDFNILNLNTFHNYSNSLTIIDLASYHESIQDFKSNTIYVYQSITIAMSSKFKKKFLTSYQKKSI